MAEKSGIEMLEEILLRLGNMEKKLDVMDRNIKTIANSSKLAELVNNAAGTKLDDWAKATKPGIAKVVAPEIPDVVKKIDAIKQKAGFKNFSFQASDASKTDQVAPRRGASLPPGSSILVKGKLKFDKGDKTVPLSGISVKIYDAQDNVVKSTKTNRAGHWMSHLPPGQYVALFEGAIDGKKLLPQNKNFEVPKELPEGQIEFEVI